MNQYIKYLILFILISFLSNISISTAGTKYLTWEDAMSIRAIRGQIISEDGNYVAYYTYPDRGDHEGYLYSVERDTTYKIPLGSFPRINKSGQWTFFTVLPKAIEKENADKDMPKNGLAIVNNANGNITNIKEVGTYKFSNDGNWLAYQIAGNSEKPDTKKKFRPLGKTLVLRNLPNESEIEISDVNAFEFDSTSRFFSYVRADSELKNNGLYIIDFEAQFALPHKVSGTASKMIGNIVWNNVKRILAFSIGNERFDGKPDSNDICLYYPTAHILDTIITYNELDSGLIIPYKNDMQWTEDGERLFFGMKLYSDTAESYEKIKYTDSSFYNVDSILTQTQSDLWNVKDPRIKPYQKIWWNKNKDYTFASYFDLKNMNFFQLADDTLNTVYYSDNPNFALGADDNKYQFRSTWQLGEFDLYNVNLRNGDKKLVSEEISEMGSLSPKGNYIVYYKNKNWYLYNNFTNENINLTSEISTPFYDEDDDTPDLPYSYGIGGWVENDEAVLIYDKYDIWMFYTKNPKSPLCITDAVGRKTKNSYRIIKTDYTKKSFAKNEKLLLSQFDTWNKNQGIATLDLSLIGATKIYMENNLTKFIAKAKNANTYLFSKESYDIFPDLWLADSNFNLNKRITDINPQLSEYNFGKMRIMDYVSAVGDTLQGYYILPDNFDANKRYPVVIFFYEIMSNDAYKFTMPWNNHLPQGPTYAGDGYVLFFPDVKFKVGSPGQSSIDCLIPACRKLAELGVADTNAIGLWGHSWSGYQAAYIITQTDFFKCAVAGAAVGNMTSAYSGIRFGSGLARQFQYEWQQSRIGGSIFDSLDAYIRNSPVFYANRANTPILLEFGNEDDAVPFSQGVELFLALRRAQKNAIMLEYRNEPHHPRKYFNRLDYAIKMKEFYDTYLKHKPAPEWITKGIEFRGK